MGILKTDASTEPAYPDRNEFLRQRPWWTATVIGAGLAISSCAPRTSEVPTQQLTSLPNMIGSGPKGVIVAGMMGGVSPYLIRTASQQALPPKHKKEIPPQNPGAPPKKTAE